jgi:DNA-binding GntR family transcriptional regulator
VTDRAGDQRKLTTGPTLSDQAYYALREDITTGELGPGQRLTERALAERLGVSPTPVREALQRLEHERLIERDSVRAIRVAEPSVVRLYELALIEAALRGTAARLAADRATAADIRRMVDDCDKAEALADQAGTADWTESRIRDVLQLTRGFHQRVNEAARSQTLIDMIATVTAFDFAFRLKRSAESHRDLASLRHSLAEHRSLVAAIEARDGDAAEEVMRRHITSRANAYLAIASRDASAVSNRSPAALRDPSATPTEP